MHRGCLFAATFFLFFSFSIDPSDLVGVLIPAVALAVLGIAGKLVSGWVATRSVTPNPPARMRAGTALVARGEFSIVIAALGAATVDGASLGALAAAYVLITAFTGQFAARYADRLATVVIISDSP